jgi:predicted lipoprotein
MASAAGALLLAAIFGSGTLVKKGSELRVPAGHDVPVADANATPDATAQARALWETKILPYLDAKAVDFATLQAAIARDPASAGARYGQRAAGDDAGWTFATKLTGSVQRLALDAVIPVLYVDADGDGKADAVVQCGPVFEGSTLRDRLDFISFATYDSQIAYGEFGTALNDLAYATASRDGCAGAATGRTLTVLGTFRPGKPGEPIVLTPARMAWSGAR